MRRSDPRTAAMISATAHAAGYSIVENASLEARNTFRVAARAAMLVDVRRRDALAELFGFAMLKAGPVLVLGEGSNILFTRDWPGVVVSLATRGIEIVEADADRAIVRVEAGENWNDFVHWSLGQGFAGLENLVAIWGTVGAAPMQNIGAYGVEVREFIRRVEVWDRAESRLAWIDNADCGFGYRDSIFKRMPDRWIITAVEFALARTHAAKLDYAGVREELAALGVETPRPAAIAEAIARIRLRKLPNPHVIGNAGSFFKNPLVPETLAATLKREHPAMPAWASSDGFAKLSAAWLVEASGYRGAREGDAGISSQHALVLVNHGHASGAELFALARRVQDGVRERFGVELQPEPLVV
jgi:UDP-N-acetylmuramate dehydrogenase